MIEEKYKKTLDSLFEEGHINEEIYEIVKTIEIDNVLDMGGLAKCMERVKNLAASGLSEIQNLKLGTTYIFLLSGIEETNMFNDIYDNFKKYCFDDKERLLKEE